MKVVGYLRCSTEKQEVSPEAQLAEIQAWCDHHGHTLISHHADIGVSGGAPLDNRPGLMAALADIRHHKANILVATKRDRLARDVILAAMLERLVQREGATIRTVQGVGDGDGPEHQLMRTMLDAFAQYERALIRARVKTALAHKSSQGEAIGLAPYGWQRVPGGKKRLNGKPVMVLAPDEAEREVMRLALWLKAGGWGPDAIGRILVKRGHLPRNGKVVRKGWHPKIIRDFIAAAEELCQEMAA